MGITITDKQLELADELGITLFVGYDLWQGRYGLPIGSNSVVSLRFGLDELDELLADPRGYVAEQVYGVSRDRFLRWLAAATGQYDAEREEEGTEGQCRGRTLKGRRCERTRRGWNHMAVAREVGPKGTGWELGSLAGFYCHDHKDQRPESSGRASEARQDTT